MEAEARGPRWKTLLPAFKPGAGWSPTPKERGEAERRRDGGEPHKAVTMATTSRYLTGRQYVTRKPLFSAEPHASILKKTPTEQEKHSGVSRGEDDQQRLDDNILTGPRWDRTPESFSLSHSDASRTDPGSPLGVSDLGSRLSREEHAFGYRSAQRSLSSSVLEVQRLSSPRRPQLSSTVLYPTYTPRSGRSGPDPTQLRPQGRERESSLRSSGRDIKGLPMSPHQANYWACAIPKASPPSPDRQSAGWDPDREYQDLLDYTYPLRPGRLAREGDSLLQTGPDLQDSGIELDHLCSSTSLSGLDFSLSAGHGSPDMQGFNKSSEGTDPMGLSQDSLDCFRDGGGTSQLDGAASSTSAARCRPASVALPRSRSVCREVDEEFWALPDQLEELQLLSRRVKEVTAQLGRPVTTSWESLEPGHTSILSSITLPEKREEEEEEEEEEELAAQNQDSDEGKDETSREDRSAAQTADLRDSETVRRTSAAHREPAGAGRSPSSLREAEVSAEQLCGLTLPSGRTSSRDDQQSDSLVQRIQVFSSHLEQLIQQLYAVSEKMELLAAPTVDIDDVKSSLSEYQGVQRGVSGQQPLTSSVLHSGRLLLGCMDRTSPLLRETLQLIERRRGALETHSEHFFSSILSAMDSLTQQSGALRGPAGPRGATV